jgi:predicted DNA-binding transcriptional regulator AlpA
MATSQSVSARQPIEYIDEDELDERYHIRPRTAQRWRAEGGGPPFVRLGKRRIAYRVADVEAWLAERTYKSRADELARASAV